MSKMEIFAKAVNCFCKELHLRGLLDRLSKICFGGAIRFMNTKIKITYINYILKLHKVNYIKHIHILVFVKCALMVHSDQIEMC